MPFSSCTRDQEKLNDVINRVRALANTVDELRAEVNTIKMSSFLNPENSPIELLALRQFEKQHRNSRKSALSKFKKCFKKRKLLKQKPGSYYYQENHSDVFPTSSGKYYGENTQGAILSERSSPPVSALNDHFDSGNEEMIKKRKSMVSNTPREFSVSQSISESSSSSVDPMEYDRNLRTWKFHDPGDAREQTKEDRRHLKRKESKRNRVTKENVKARFSTNDKREPSSSSDLTSSQLSDDDLSTEKDSLKYQRSVTFIDRRRELPRMTAQRSQTSSVSVISTEDPDLVIDYGDRVKQSKNAWKVPMKSKLKNRIKRRSSNILRSRKKGKMKKVDCGTNCPYFKDVHVDNSTDQQVSIATDTVTMPRLTEHRKTQTENDVNNGRKEETSEKRRRQNRKVKYTRIAKVSSSKSESSSSDSQGSNSKRKSCCPFKKGSTKQENHISLNSDSESVESNESSDVNAKFPIEKRPIIVSQSSISDSVRSMDSVNNREADFGKNKKDIGVSVNKFLEDTEKMRESKIQSRSIDGPTNYDSSRVANKPTRRALFKIGKKRTQTLLPARRNLPDNTPGAILGKATENFENSQAGNMHLIYPHDLESNGERRVHGKEAFPKISKKQRTTQKSNRKKRLDGSSEAEVISVSNLSYPSEKKGSTTTVGAEKKIFDITKDQIEKSNKHQRNRYDSQKYPTRINVQPYVYQASCMHRNERPLIKESLSSFPRKWSEYIYSQSALVNIKSSDNSCCNSKNEPSENSFIDTLCFIENQPRSLLDSRLRMTEISNRLYNCLHRLDHIIS